MDSMAKFSAMASNIRHLKSKGSDKIGDPQAVNKWSEIRMSMKGVGGALFKSGWLRKQGGMVKTWHRRWFVLNGDYLFYFQKEDDVRPLGMIYLPGNKIIQHPANPEEPDKFLLELIPAEKELTIHRCSQGKTMPAMKMAPNHETFLLSAATDEERQDWIRAIRKVMFANKGGAIFGNSLAETMEFERTRSDRKVPYIVESCIEFLTKYGLEIEGIFRLPGRMLLVRDLKDRFDEGETFDLEEEDADIHSVASLIKQYFRELPECLIPYNKYQEFMNIAMRYQGNKAKNTRNEEVELLRTLMTDIPRDNYNCLKYLCAFLHRVADNTSINKMTVQNLARVFGPNIIRHPQMDDNPEVFMLTTADISEQLAYMMINYDDKIFSVEFDDGRKSVNVAVDDLLRLDENEEVEKLKLVQPMSAMDDLSSIIIDQKGDRQGRSFCTDTNLLQQFQSTNLENQSESQQEGVLDPSRQSEDFVKVPRPAPRSVYVDERKPIPPLRKKYMRNHSSVGHTTSNDSISSELSNSSNSLDGSTNDVCHRNSMRSSSRNSDSEPNTLVLELQQKLDTLTAENNTLKAKYDNLNASKAKSDARVKNLSDEMRKIQNRYDEHITNLENRHKAQVNELCVKLDEEKSSRAEAVQKVLELQKTIQTYQMQYGDIKDKLPPLYPEKS
ncbi:rho GTPase-activating protein 24-like isoform X3 [Mya arenaria]|uniref:rho GTPase-activating protein 24-like isoform X3 n=1 Tax=Mya arenaria TaxID=6604 RepID=UPI0022E2236D|nr:rho GTPase-activating protein 24-like isoform X3 [Mya arenaria]